MIVFFKKIIMCPVHLRCSSTKTPRNFIEDNLFMSKSLIFKIGKLKGKMSLLKIVNVVLSSFKDSLLARNHSEIFFGSKFVFNKRVFISSLKQNKFVSSANKIGFKISGTWHKSFI